jgi:hypothetical protein
MDLLKLLSSDTRLDLEAKGWRDSNGTPSLVFRREQQVLLLGHTQSLTHAPMSFCHIN